MGKKSPHPRYNVLCFRASDTELEELLEAMSATSRQQFLLEAALEKARGELKLHEEKRRA